MGGIGVLFASDALRWLLLVVTIKTPSCHLLTSHWLMITTNRPFQVACWALMIAFGLSMIVAVSDPRAVRVAILAKAEQSRSPSEADAVLVADAGDSSAPIAPGSDRSQPIPSHDNGNLPASVQTTTPPPALPHRTVTNRMAQAHSPFVSSQPVSSYGGQPRGGVEFEPRPPDSTMLVVSPEQLHGEFSRHQEVEFLPPPPEQTRSLESWSAQEIVNEPTLPSQSEPSSDADLNQRWLEREILSLRQEVHRLSQAQQITEQLDRLQQQQQEVLDLHQNLPQESLLEVIELLRQQLVSVRETFPPPPRDPLSPSALSGDRASQLIGEVSSSGNGRVSLTITEAELDDILQLLERVSGTPLGKPSDAHQALPREAGVEPQLSLPTAAKPTDVQPLSYEEPAASDHGPPATHSTRCAACHQGSMQR